MLKKKTMRFLSIIASLALALSISACTSENADDNVSDNTAVSTGEALFDSSVELDITIGSFVSWPYDENWKMWQYFREAVGGKLNVTAIPNTDFGTKLSLMMASPDKLPDLIHTMSKQHIDNYALVGAYMPISDNLDKMPNYTAFWETIPEPERTNRLELRTSGDGKCYFPQVYGNDRMASNQVWMYRKDIFEKHNLKVPETMDELFDVCVELKKLYPDSYPFTMYNYNTIATIGPQWKNNFQHYVYYDFEKEEWCYGATEDTMKEIIEFLIKCVDAKILAPDFMTMTAKAWEELVSTDRGFIMPSYTIRIDEFNRANRQQNPQYTWEAMMPPKAGENGQNLIAHTAPDGSGYAIVNTGKEESIDNAFKLVDWMYTDEACELLSWGKEGETYEVVDGKRKYILDGENTPLVQYGIMSYGLMQRVDPEACIQMAGDDQNRAIDLTLSNMEANVNPKIWIAFSDEELNSREMVRPAIETYTDEMLSKFILKQRPLSEWDSFVKELEDLGLQQLLDVHISAYSRVKAAQ